MRMIHTRMGGLQGKFFSQNYRIIHLKQERGQGNNKNVVGEKRELFLGNHRKIPEGSWAGPRLFRVAGACAGGHVS